MVIHELLLTVFIVPNKNEDIVMRTNMSNDSREKIYRSLEEFCAELSLLGVSKIVCATINEKRPIQKDQHSIEVVPIKHLEVIAYNKSVLYKYIHIDDDFESLYTYLYEKGFEHKIVSRNIT